MPNDHTISITLSPEAFAELSDGGFALYAFHALGTSAASALPVVWKKVPLVLNPIRLAWSETFAAYVATGALPVGSTVDVTNRTAAAPGQIVRIGSGGTFDVADGGPAGQITIENDLPAKMMCGLAQTGDCSDIAPIATMPLYPGSALSIAVVPRVVLLFAAQDSLDAGIVVRDFPSPSTKNSAHVADREERTDLVDDGSATPLLQFPPCLVDCSRSTSIDIGYDLDTGTWTPVVSVTTLGVDTKLVPLLVHAGA